MKAEKALFYAGLSDGRKQMNGENSKRGDLHFVHKLVTLRKKIYNLY